MIASEPHGHAAVDELLSLCRFPVAGSELSCAVSGGPDSLALLVLAVRAGCVVTAFHVDHGLRPGSGQEADVVAEAAHRYGAGFRALRVEVGPGPNLEARARRARRGVLPAGTATGHTADDQAETVLLNLLRGAGLNGLSGMRHGVDHPILGLRRADTHGLCESEGLVSVRDPSNSDLALRRNRLRAEAMDTLAEVAERDLVPVLARQAELLAEEADLLDELARGLDASDARTLAQAPAPLARRAIRSWLRGDGPYPPSAAEVERVLDVARGTVLACEVSGGIRVARSGQRLRLIGSAQ
ncbi:MAG: tRNA lysidine(34) synthetase TilS [Acidimicrobiales bacterium]